MNYVTSLDIETYGKWKHYPEQQHFTPQRSRYLARIPPSDQILSCSLTFCVDPRPTPSHPWDCSLVASLRPSFTFIVPLSARFQRAVPGEAPPGLAHAWPTLLTSLHTPIPTAISLICAALSRTDTLIGMNLAYDLNFLTYCVPGLSRFLNPDTHPHLLDLSYISFLESDVRPERSLKDIGPVFNLYRYADEDLEQHSCPLKLLHYNGMDTHNAVTAVSHTASEILRNPRRGDKLSSFCISHFSSTIWNCVEMTANGVPFSIPALTSLATRLQSDITTACSEIPFPIMKAMGPEPMKHRSAFMLRLLEVASRHANVSEDPLIQYTPATRELSFSEANRSHLLSLIPPSDPDHASLASICSSIERWSSSSKLFGTYVAPMLWRTTNRQKRIYRSVLVPSPSSPSPQDPPPCPLAPLSTPKARKTKASSTPRSKPKDPSPKKTRPKKAPASNSTSKSSPTPSPETTPPLPSA
jgi:hypothetical protein